MSVNSEHSNSIRRYLLGDLPDQERDKIEDLLMADSDAYQELLNAEDDLIDDYVFNVLPEADRKKFTQRFLTVPELRQNVSRTTALRKHALQTRPEVVAEKPVVPPVSLFDRLRNYFMQPALATSFAVLVAALALNGWLLRQNSQLRARLEGKYQLGASTEELAKKLAQADRSNAELLAKVEQQEKDLVALKEQQLAQQQADGLKSGRGPLKTFVLALTSGAVRDSGEWKKFSRDPAIGQVSFELDVAPDDYKRYQADLQTVEGQHKVSKKNLTLTRGNLVTFTVPATILDRGDYDIVLRGVNSSGGLTEIAHYYFRVN